MLAAPIGRGLLIVLGLSCLAAHGFASAFVRGAYYRLGEDDPEAMPGVIGNDVTRDSFADGLDLTRIGSPRYWSDVPPQSPFGSTLSMAFANEGLGGPAFPGIYGRTESLPMIEQGYALEAWVKAGPTYLDSIRNNLLAYNGEPDDNGFGLYLHADDYVVRIGTFERVLGPANVGEWHHLAYIQSLGTAGYYYDGKLVHETASDPLPAEAVGGFWLGGADDGMGGVGHSLFNGWIDEVRYQSFNPLAAGAFDPTNFLIEPTSQPGDYNGNGIVEQADLDLVLGHWGEDATAPPEDWITDPPSGLIDQAELDRVLANWGHTRPSAAVVPEPTAPALLLTATAMVVLLWLRRSS